VDGLMFMRMEVFSVQLAIRVACLSDCPTTFFLRKVLFKRLLQTI
jgi:hypothetical protein